MIQCIDLSRLVGHFSNCVAKIDDSWLDENRLFYIYFMSKAGHLLHYDNQYSGAFHFTSLFRCYSPSIIPHGKREIRVPIFQRFLKEKISTKSTSSGGSIMLLAFRFRLPVRLRRT